jgi:hypothetical protein
MNLDPNQKRHFLIIFEHIDGLLEDIERNFSAERSLRLFNPCIPDIAVEKQTEFKRKIAEFRALMSEVLGNLEIRSQPPHISALQSSLTTLTFVDIALEELKSKYMRGYGELAQETAVNLDDTVLNLQQAVGRISKYLLASKLQSGIE